MIHQLLSAATAAGFSFIVYDPSEDGVDYVGDCQHDALDAIEAVDEINVDLVDDEGEIVGTAFIVNDLDDDEQIADASGWVSRWMDEK